MIYLGKLLTKDDLSISFYTDQQGSSDGSSILVDPFLVAYTVYDCSSGIQEIIRQTINSNPIRCDTGIYYAGIKLHPSIFRLGRHVIQWTFKRYPESSMRSESRTFDVVRRAHYSGEYCRTTYVNDKIVL